MDFFMLLTAFIFGFGCRLIQLPPLVGYLIAGFTLNVLGFENTDSLQILADLGITIMLFTIGLKLNLRDLAHREVWLGGTLHMLSWVVVGSILLLGCALIGIPLFSDLTMQTAALVAFALSFSSTVCVVKILDEASEMQTRHGKLAIGVLILQDLFAVIFLVVATGKIPSIYALFLFLLIPAAPLLKRLLNQVGHGELLPIAGLIIAIGGYELFELVGVKGDLGALLVGILYASHAKASELAKSLMNFKDLLLIGFFITIGLTALPDLQMVLIALGLCVLLMFKYAMFILIFSQLRLRIRTSYLGSLLLSNYSEFGLIVGATAVSFGLMQEQWLVILALVVSFSFVFTSVLYRNSHTRYSALKPILTRFERQPPLKQDKYPLLDNAEVLVIGMGRVGRGAFYALQQAMPGKVWGMDADDQKIAQIRQDYPNVILGDGENGDLWENLDISGVRLIMLALPSTEDTSNITALVRTNGYSGVIAAIARFEDQIEPLQKQGVDKVFNFFTEAGLGFAEESIQLIDDRFDSSTKVSTQVSIP